MKKQASVIALGALLSLAMTATSFAASAHPAKRAKPQGAHPRYYDVAPGYYNPAVPEGNYTTFYPSYNSYNGGSVSSAVGGLGR